MADPGVTLESVCGPTPTFTCEKVFNATGSEFWTKFADWVVAKPLTITLIIVVAVIVNRVLRRLVKKSMGRMFDPSSSRTRRALQHATPSVLQQSPDRSLRLQARAQTLTTVVRGLVSVVVYFTAIVSILQVLDINLAPFIASAGIAGVALGFGAQNIVRDFLAGTFIVVEDQFGVGDIVDIGDAKGTVEQVTLRTTRVRDVNGTLWHVPNGQILRVANKSQQWARAVLDIEVDGDTSYDELAAVIQRVSDELSIDDEWKADVLEEPEVWGIEAFTPEGYTVRLVIKTRPASQFGLMRELRIRLKAAFDEAGIVLAAARPEMWIHTDDPAPGPPPADPPAAGSGAHAKRGDPAEAG